MGGRGSGGRAAPAVWKRYTIRPRNGSLPVSFHSSYLDACDQLGRMVRSYYKITLDRIEDGQEVASIQLWPVK